MMARAITSCAGALGARSISERDYLISRSSPALRLLYGRYGSKEVMAMPNGSRLFWLRAEEFASITSAV